MKAIKILITIAVVLVAMGYGVYYYGTKIASEKLVSAVSNQLEQSGELENIKKSVENDPELKSFVEDAKNADTSKLPFHTKEEATRVLVKKFGVSGLMDMQTKVQNGSMTREDLMQEAESKLTEEEILALKVIAYKELYK
jgi:UbiD family decarboxylase